MRSLSEIMIAADTKVADAHDMVTKAIRRALVRAGFPREVAEKYSANHASGGEWILEDDIGELATFDILFRDEESLVNAVRSVENGEYDTW